MKRQITIWGALIPLILLIVAGCDKKSANTASTEGDYTDINYQLAREDADSIVVDMNVDNGEVSDWMGWNGGMPRPEVDSVVYDSTSGWHIRSREIINDYLTFSVVDSFRLADIDGAYQRHRDSLTNTFERRLKKDFELSGGQNDPGTIWTRDRQRNALWDGLADTVVTLNADFNRYWSGTNEYRNFSREVSGVLTDIQFYTGDLFDGRPTHPFAGALTAEMTHDVVRPNGQFHLEGNLTITFYPDHYHARLERGDNWWEWDHYYE